MGETRGRIFTQDQENSYAKAQRYEEEAEKKVPPDPPFTKGETERLHQPGAAGLLAGARVGILNNPAGGANKRRGGEWMQRVLREFPRTLHEEVRTPAEIETALDGFARQGGLDLLVLSGGDGTVQAALTVLFGRCPLDPMPLLAVLPSGTTNMTAGDVGVRGNREGALRRLLRRAESGRGKATVTQRPLIQVDPAAERTVQFGLFFGAAGILQGMRFYRERVHPAGVHGEAGPAVTMARLLFNLLRGRGIQLEAESITIGIGDQARQHRDCLILFVTTLERFFLGLRPFWGREAGALHTTIIGPGPRHLLRVLPSLLRGRTHPLLNMEHGYSSHNTDELHLELSGGFALDGEVFDTPEGTGAVVLRSAGPACFVR